MGTAEPLEGDVLREVVRRLVVKFAPRRILLYGSRATGTARKESDYDFLIVWRDETPPANRAATVREALLDLDPSMDIAVVTPREFERFRTRRMHIVAVADREGKILYAA